jgi:hypothetical protein
MMALQPVSWQSVGLLAVVGGGILAYYKQKDEERKAIITGADPSRKFVPISRNFDINGAPTATIHGKGVGRPAIGGDFDLIDHHGKVVKGSTRSKSCFFIIYAFRL